LDRTRAFYARLDTAKDMTSTQTTQAPEWHEDPRATLEPSSHADFDRVKAYVDRCRQGWLIELRAARRELQDHLVESGWCIVSGRERGDALRDHYRLEGREVVVQGRLKKPDRIVEKMSRFNEALVTMLDLWGFRILVAGEAWIDRCVADVERLWATPTSDQLLLRRGTLAFPPKRDYRHSDHAGRSAATSDRYDEAVHINRRRRSGVCEIQVMSHDLFARAFLSDRADEGHRRFAHRRRQLVQGDAR
jgi:hypothetical protein